MRSAREHDRTGWNPTGQVGRGGRGLITVYSKVTALMRLVWSKGPSEGQVRGLGGHEDLGKQNHIARKAPKSVGS